MAGEEKVDVGERRTLSVAVDEDSNLGNSYSMSRAPEGVRDLAPCSFAHVRELKYHESY